ncbi:MAG: LytTR family DNA-binding domain-containing protein [Saprospiraceae bacterium]|nr:response regulator transcription factor [Lewinella sp.]
MRKIKTLVVDDEPLARARICKLLSTYDYITLLGECRNGKEALRQIVDYRPDLVFLDIQMPDFNGFDVLSKMEKEQLPFIIFVTAYDQYALKAFDVHAVDYLLKPYDNDRFGRALEHARQQIQTKDQAVLHHRMVKVLNDFEQQQLSEDLQLEVRDKGKTFTINVLDIQCVEAQGNYLQIHLEDAKYLIRQTLQAFEEQVTGHPFLRIHRSVLINTHYLAAHRYDGNGQYHFTLRNGKQLQSSRGYREEIERFLDL